MATWLISKSDAQTATGYSKTYSLKGYVITHQGTIEPIELVLQT